MHGPRPRTHRGIERAFQPLDSGTKGSTARAAAAKLSASSKVGTPVVSKLFEPHASLTDPEDRRRSRLLGISLAVLGLLFACVDASLALTLPHYTPPWHGYVLLTLAFALNRSGYYQLAAPLTVLTYPGVIFTITHSGHGMPFLSFGYLVIAPMVAAIFLPMWGVALITLVDLLGIASAAWFEPSLVADAPQLIGPLSVNAMVGVLALLYMHHRNGLERDRRRALEDSEERARMSLDAAQMGTWQLDCTQQQLTLDARAGSMMGQVAGLGSLIEMFHPDDAEALRTALEGVTSGKLPGFLWTGKSRRTCASRALAHYLELSGRAVTDAHGRVVRVNGTIVDISERRSLEEQLRRSQKLEALGRLSGGVAHDFNNVLTVILASVALLRRSSAAEELDHIDDAAQSAAALTRKLLTFSRGAVLDPRLLDVDALVRKATPMLARLIGEDVVVRHHVSDTPCMSYIDGSQLEQVLFNLAANARDAMPNGGTLDIKVDNIVLTSRDVSRRPQATAGSYVRLRVTDNGLGMDEAVQRHIFEPFFTTKERGKGTGLGLATVFNTVSQSGGFIEVLSMPHAGTRFDLYFPRARGCNAEAPALRPRLCRGCETLLLVEDDDAVRKMVGRILEDAGYRVLSAVSVPQAEQLLAQHPQGIALVITDEIMPGGRGSALVAQLRVARPTLPALCITGYADCAALAQLTELPTLQKPFADHVLLRRVRELLDQPGVLASSAQASPRLES